MDAGLTRKNRGVTVTLTKMEHDLNYWALTVTTILILIGLAGTVLPVIPGVVIVWLGLIVYKLWVPEDLTWTFIIINGVLALVAQILDFVMSYYGARRFGATWRGGVGALLGAIIGPFVLTPLVGLILGPIIGAVIGELSAGRTAKESGKAGVGTIVGAILSSVLKLAIAAFMAGWFYWKVFT